MVEGIGSETRNKYKSGFFVFYLFLIVIVGIISVFVLQLQIPILWYITIFGTPALVVLAYNMLSPEDKYVDAVPLDEPRYKFWTIKKVFVLSLLLSVGLVLQVWYLRIPGIPQPTLLLSNPVSNISTIIIFAIFESVTFIAILFPSTFKIVKNKYDNNIISFLIAASLIAGLFAVGHYAAFSSHTMDFNIIFKQIGVTFCWAMLFEGALYYFKNDIVGMTLQVVNDVIIILLGII